MSVTVTIHKGEMKQIKRLVDEKKSAKGQLYGLWTHSFQPVIQYVIGDPKPGRDDHEKKIKNYLWDNHGLKHLGNWSTGGGNNMNIEEETPSFVNMTVESTDDKTVNVKLCVVQKGSNPKDTLEGVIEMLDGDSVFRLNAGPFAKEGELACYHNKKVPGPLEVVGQRSNEAKTKKEQWYSTKEGMQLFGKIHGALQQQFEITGTSRDTKTHDISLTLKYHGQEEYIVDFPLNFPHGAAVLNNGKSKQEISLTEKESGEKSQSIESGQQPNKSSKATNPGSGTSKKQKKKVTPAEETTEEQDDLSANKTASLQNETESQQQLDPEKVPELLVQGILAQVQKSVGTMV